MNPIPPFRFSREQAVAAGTYNPLQFGWSDWMRALVPQAVHQLQFDIQRPNGWRRRSHEILAMVPGLHHDVGAGFGIYEWQARKIENGNDKMIVVHIGSTSRSYPESSLRDRVVEYCVNGAHKKEQIDNALENGYEMWVRVKSAPDRETAEDLEDELLDAYDYAWNTRRNGSMRDVVL